MTARRQSAPALLALLALAPLIVGWSWNLDDLPPSLRERVHLEARDVPSLPGDDPSLGDPLAWPETMVLWDYLCTLRVQEVNGSALAWVRSLQAVRPGAGFALSYVCAPADNWAATRGPHYLWNGEGTLIERYWVTPDTLRDIVTGHQYYPSGQFLRYYHREDVKDPRWFDPRGPYEWFEEFFGKDGNLVGCAYSKLDGHQNLALACYWAGEQVEYDDFRALKRSLFTKMFP